MAKQVKSVSGKVVAITGGAQGIGTALYAPGRAASDVKSRAKALVAACRT